MVYSYDEEELTHQSKPQTCVIASDNACFLLGRCRSRWIFSSNNICGKIDSESIQHQTVSEGGGKTNDHLHTIIQQSRGVRGRGGQKPITYLCDIDTIPSSDTKLQKHIVTSDGSGWDHFFHGIHQHDISCKRRSPELCARMFPYSVQSTGYDVFVIMISR